MPWDADEFKRKHFKKAKGGQAGHAAKIANAMLKRGVREGTAIATGIARAKAGHGASSK